MKTFVPTLFLVLHFIIVPGWLWAHGGSHDPPAQKEEATLPALPEAKMEMESSDPGGIDYGVGDAMDAFESEEIVGEGPLWGEEPPSPMAEKPSHEMSAMKHVEPAEHEWISTSKKGYGWAAALTLLSGAVFGFLTFRRPCE